MRVDGSQLLSRAATYYDKLLGAAKAGGTVGRARKRGQQERQQSDGGAANWHGWRLCCQYCAVSQAHNSGHYITAANGQTSEAARVPGRPLSTQCRRPRARIERPEADIRCAQAMGRMLRPIALKALCSYLFNEIAPYRQSRQGVPLGRTADALPKPHGVEAELRSEVGSLSGTQHPRVDVVQD